MIVKDPYAWVGSYAKYRKVASSPVDPTMLSKWNEANRHYLDYCVAHPTRSTFVRYEDVAAAPRDTMDSIAKKYCLTRTERIRFALRFEMTTNGRAGRTLFDRSKYAEKRFMALYTAADMELFRNRLDRELVVSLGYEVHDGWPVQS